MVLCHLGSGASVTAIKDGKSFDTSMGFSPVAGITMSTRSGDVDPSLLQFIMKKGNITSFNEVIKMLNTESGLLGLSGISPDMRDIEKLSKMVISRLNLQKIYSLIELFVILVPT